MSSLENLSLGVSSLFSSRSSEPMRRYSSLPVVSWVCCIPTLAPSHLTASAAFARTSSAASASRLRLGARRSVVE